MRGFSLFEGRRSFGVFCFSLVVFRWSLVGGCRRFGVYSLFIARLSLFVVRLSLFVVRRFTCVSSLLKAGSRIWLFLDFLVAACRAAVFTNYKRTTANKQRQTINEQRLTNND